MKQLHPSMKKRNQLKREIEEGREKEREVKEANFQQREKKRKRNAEIRKKKEENELKSMVFQRISTTKKFKKLSKKQKKHLMML